MCPFTNDRATLLTDRHNFLRVLYIINTDVDGTKCAQRYAPSSAKKKIAQSMNCLWRQEIFFIDYPPLHFARHDRARDLDTLPPAPPRNTARNHSLRKCP